MANKLVGFKATDTEREAMEWAVQLGLFRSVSALLRAGMIRILDDLNLKQEARTAIRLERVKHGMRKRKKNAPLTELPQVGGHDDEEDSGNTPCVDDGP